MARIIPLAAAALLAASCSPRPASQVRPNPPPGPERCQEGTPVPPAPRPPRTVEQLGSWAITAERAARQTERARAACAENYARLRDWAATFR
jgi:hypothetical protein